MQCALIAYDVCKGTIASEDQSQQLTNHFATKVAKALERNCLKVCDPNVNSRLDLSYRKLNYTLPEEIKHAMKDAKNEEGDEMH